MNFNSSVVTTQKEDNMGKVKTKNRIVMFGQKSIPSSSGGIEAVVEQLAVRMVGRGYPVTCFLRSTDCKEDSTGCEEYMGVRTVRIPAIKGRGISAASSAFFSSIKSAFGPYDIVHIHGEGQAYMCWLPKLCGKKVVVTVHGLDYMRKKWGLFASTVILAGEKMAVRFADEIIVLSHSAQDYFLNKYNRGTVFIPNGAEEQKHYKAAVIKEKWGLEAGDYYLYMGRLVQEKGLEYLIEAFKTVKTDKRMIIAGDSAASAEYREALKENAASDERINFVGEVSGEVKAELYSNAYAFVLPSDLEGMSVSLLEAMSFGRCCLVSDIPENIEVVEDRALSFKHGNAADLAEKLQLIQDDVTMMKKYMDGAAEYILGRFNWNIITEETLKLYDAY